MYDYISFDGFPCSHLFVQSILHFLLPVLHPSFHFLHFFLHLFHIAVGFLYSFSVLRHLSTEFLYFSVHLLHLRSDALSKAHTGSACPESMSDLLLLQLQHFEQLIRYSGTLFVAPQLAQCTVDTELLPSTVFSTSQTWVLVLAWGHLQLDSLLHSNKRQYSVHTVLFFYQLFRSGYDYLILSSNYVYQSTTEEKSLTRFATGALGALLPLWPCGNSLQLPLEEGFSLRCYPPAVCYRRWYGLWPAVCYRRWFSGPLYSLSSPLTFSAQSSFI